MLCVCACGGGMGVGGGAGPTHLQCSPPNLNSVAVPVAVPVTVPTALPLIQQVVAHHEVLNVLLLGDPAAARGLPRGQQLKVLGEQGGRGHTNGHEAQGTHKVNNVARLNMKSTPVPFKLPRRKTMNTEMMRASGGEAQMRRRGGAEGAWQGGCVCVSPLALAAAPCG
jgi:hypothetical protein